MALSTGREKGHGNINVINSIFIDINIIHYIYSSYINTFIRIGIFKIVLILQSLHLLHIQVALGDRWHLLNRSTMEGTHHT